MRCAQRAIVIISMLLLLSVGMLADSAAKPTAAGDSVNVLGAVSKPGVYEFSQGLTFRDSIAKAGGLASSADETGIVIRRKGQQQALEVDYSRAMKNESPFNLLLKPGDVIYVPEGPTQVAVMGAVKKPGLYSLKDKSTLLDLIAMAGGPTRQGDLSNVRIVRSALKGERGEVITFDLRTTLSRATPSPDVMPGDVVFVPSSYKEPKPVLIAR